MKEMIVCEHVADGAKVAYLLPIGKDRYVQLCQWCEEVLKGEILQAMINEAVKDFVKGMFHR